jgi:threonylcarbamoyladenosine tRNA methylthiotransferase MtaB
VDLISEIENIDGILRIRLSSIEAKDVTDELIKKMKASPKLCPHLHIPFQSGDNKILKLMNRKDTRESYLNLVKKLKKNIKDIGISCDIMIGFPGEGEREFLNTLDFLKKVKPMRTHIFCFQPRDLTPLAGVPQTIEKQELKRRFSIVKELTDSLALKFKQRFLNRQLAVLVEEKKDGLWRGYTPNYLLTFIKSSDNLNLSNKIIKAKINERNF